MGRTILPTVGACAVFTIDCVASLDPEVQQDPTAVAACKALMNKTYAVLVSDRRAFYAPDEPYNPCTVHFISQGDPPHVSRPMYRTVDVVADLPNDHAVASIIAGSLERSQPLPWNDCYVTCFLYAFVRSPTKFTEEPIGCMFEPAEMNRHDRLLSEDVERKLDLLKANELELDG